MLLIKPFIGLNPLITPKYVCLPVFSNKLKLAMIHAYHVTQRQKLKIICQASGDDQVCFFIHTSLCSTGNMWVLLDVCFNLLSLFLLRINDNSVKEEIPVRRPECC